MNRDLQSQLQKASQKLSLNSTKFEIAPIKTVPTAKTAPTAAEKPRISVEVRNRNRAGRAPYNFIPLPQEPRWYYKEPPASNRYEGASGYIDLNLETLSRFFIRGMRTVQDHKDASRMARENDGPPAPHADAFSVFPSSPQGGIRYAFPGSSLRGMVRNMVEILGASPLDPINGDRQLFYRAVASDDMPGDPRHPNVSFDSNAVAYKKRLAQGRGTRNNPASPIAKAGYLTGSKGDWTIVPADVGPYGEQWYRIEKWDLPSERGGNQEKKLPLYPDRGDANPRQVWYQPPAKPEPSEYHSHRGKWYEFGIVREVQLTQRAGLEEGWLIRSGKAPNDKYAQWIIRKPDQTKTQIIMQRADVDAYLSDCEMSNANINAKIKYKDSSKNVPCFYVEWKDHLERPHVSIGHTGYFRLPYEKLVGGANRCARAEGEQRWDLAQAMFGRTRISSGSNKREGRRGRVFLEDAVSTTCHQPAGDPLQVVLGTPKLTTHQHYLVQEGEEREDSIHWDGKWDLQKGGSNEEDTPVITDPAKVCVRGWKRYWHRGDAPFQVAGADPRRRENPKVITKFRPGPKSCEFVARIRFENLDDVELGALLTAIELPDGHAHMIGMAKPLGFGSFKVTSCRVTIFDRKARYSSLFERNEDGSLRLRTGELEPKECERRVSQAKTAFSQWALKDQSVEGDLWSLLDGNLGDAAELVRLRELKAMLRFGPPEGRTWADWQNATRYLEFNSFDFHRPNEPRPYSQAHYNEYRNVGYRDGWQQNPGARHANGEWSPNPRVNRQERAPVETRRPLPPASQVAQMGPEIPTDPRPPFGRYDYGNDIAPPPDDHRQPRQRFPRRG